MRAGYGPRVRRFGDNFNRYELADGKRMYRQYGNSHSGVGIDQLKFVIEKFKEDLGTREAVITIHDAMSDDFDMGAGGGALLVTKDTPCTRSIHFMVVDGRMNCYVDMRSNDCFTYETKIPLLNGEVWEIGRLAEEKANEQFWVYSRNEKGKIVVGLAHHPRKMRKVSEIMEVKLDNDEIIRCTPDHRFMLKDGTYQKIQDIPIGTSLASLLGNHKIISKRITKEEVDVYDITVEKYHNFALESGVFVHNCVWGFSAVNVFNFTLMQEYVAMLVGVPVGEYYHKVDNLHIYESSLPAVKAVAEHYNGFWQGVDSTLPEWHYEHGFTTLQEFDAWVERLASYEANLRGDVNLPDLPYTDSEALERLKDFDAEPLFADWARIFYRKWIKKPVNFVNPYLNILF